MSKVLPFGKIKRIDDDWVMQEFRKGTCSVCSSQEVDPAHIKSRGSGGDDVPTNLVRLCRMHHSESHALGWFKFTQKYPIMLIVFKAKGWKFIEEGGKPKLVRID